MKKNGRLENIINLIPYGTETLADIGCDHGKIIVSAILTGRCKRGIAVDISEQSLNKAKNLADTVGISHKLEFICGNGFCDINQKIDTAVIAGMGGNEIISILSQKHSVDTYILCPHQDAEVLREYMNLNNISAIYDFYTKDNNKYYPLIMAKKGCTLYTEDELFLGKNMPPNEIYFERNTKRYLYLKSLFESKNMKQHNCDTALINEYEVLKKWLKLQI